MNTSLILLMVLMGVATLLVVVPMIKQEVKVSAFRKNLKVGDYCTTHNGYEGRIQRINDTMIEIHTWEGAYEVPKQKVYP